MRNSSWWRLALTVVIGQQPMTAENPFNRTGARHRIEFFPLELTLDRRRTERRRLASPPLWSCDYGAANYPLDDPASPPDPNANRPRDGTSDAPWLDLPENAVPRCETTRPAAVPTPSAGAWIVFLTSAKDDLLAENNNGHG